MITLKKADHLIFENIDDLLMPFLDLAFGMIGVKPNISSQDSDIPQYVSSGIFTYMNQSKDLYDIREEIADFLTSCENQFGRPRTTPWQHLKNGSLNIFCGFCQFMGRNP